MTLQLNVAIGYLAFIWPFVVIWFLPIAAFVAVWFNWHRRETFKEWKELLALADREVEEWSQTTAVPDEVAALQKFLKQAHKYYWEDIMNYKKRFGSLKRQDCVNSFAL